MNPTQLKRRSYERAQELIRSGSWVVDAEAGTIWSAKTQALLVGSEIDGGYRRHPVCGDGWSGTVLRHRVIWEFVNGPIPDGLEVNHKDGDGRNNSIANLELLTHPENVLHANRIGLRVYHVGRPGTARKLTAEQVRAIRTLLNGGSKQDELARRFGVAPSSISDIRCGRSWAHVA